MFNLIHLLAILLTGLIAGLFYGYDCSVIKGLGDLPDKAYLSSFQSINKAILNPYFFTSFMGSLLVLPVATWLSFKTPDSHSFYWLLASSLVYIIGVFGVTVIGNVPLNNLLDQFDLSGSSPEAIKAMRQKFETGWNTLHHVRTYAAIIAFILAIISAIKT